MVQTYTSSWIHINDNETTTHDPTTMVGESNIEILSSEVQWEGVRTSSSSGYYDYDTNTNSESDTVTESTETDSNTNSSIGQPTASTTYPSVPSNHSFDGHDGAFRAENANDTEITLSYTITLPLGSYSDTTTIEANSGIVDVDTFSTDTNRVGESVSIELDSDSDSPAILSAVANTYGTSTSVDSASVNVSFPSTDSGYSHYDHDWEMTVENTTDSDVTANWSTSAPYTVYNYGSDGVENTIPAGQTVTLADDSTSSNWIGDSASISSSEVGLKLTITHKTRGRDYKSTTDYHYTQDPSISGDVSADSGNIHLSDNETSNWYTLSGLDPTSEDFTHNIVDSDEAYFRFRFDWEYAYPTAISVERVTINGTNYDVRLVDPSDAGLEYDCYRVNVTGDGILAYDVVSPSDADALPYYIYHPTHGKLALREKTT